MNQTNKPGAGSKRIVTVAPNNERGFEQQLNVVEDALLERWGIELGKTDWLIHAKPLIGRKLQYTRYISIFPNFLSKSLLVENQTKSVFGAKFNSIPIRPVSMVSKLRRSDQIWSLSMKSSLPIFESLF